LRRYNGKHQHTNKIEKETFFNFHIHYATERYQQFGMDEDGYAQPTEYYTDLQGAFQSLIKECNLILPPDTQPNLL
jgi:hypothetical protein